MLETAGGRKILRRLLPPFALLALGGALALYLAAVWLCGGSPAGAVLYAAAFAVLVVLPGLFLAGWLLPAARFAERAVLAVPLGALLLVLCFAGLGRVLPAWLCGAPDLVLGAVWLYRRRKRLTPPRFSAVPAAVWWLAALYGAALFVHVFCGLLPAARASAAGNMVYDQDLLWSVGNAAAVRYGAPLRDIHAAGGALHYHYFTDVAAGLVAVFSGRNAWDALCYYNWPLWAALLLGAAYLCARRFGAGPLASLLAPAGVFFCHFAWDISQKHVFVNVNGVLQNYGMLAAALLAVQLAEADKWRTKRGVAALGGVLAALCWSKSMMGLLFICAAAAAVAAGRLLRRGWNLWLGAAAAVGLAAFALLYILVYRHAINNMVWAPGMAKLWDAARILLGMYGPGTLLYLVSLAVSVREVKKLSYAALLCNAMVPGGILAFVLFDHYAFSQSYFLLAAAFFMWLCVGRTAGRLFTRQALAAGAALVCAAGAAASVWYQLPTFRRGVQIALRGAGQRPSFAWQADTVTPDDAAAAAWLRDNLTAEDVFATNRNDRAPDLPDGLFHYYTAASGRQAFVEGWRCAMDYSMNYHALRFNLEQVSDGIFAFSSWGQARALARRHGIGYLLMYLPEGCAPYPGVEPVFSSDTVLIYRVE